MVTAMARSLGWIVTPALKSPREPEQPVLDAWCRLSVRECELGQTQRPADPWKRSDSPEWPEPWQLVGRASQPGSGQGLVGQSGAMPPHPAARELPRGGQASVPGACRSHGHIRPLLTISRACCGDLPGTVASAGRPVSPSAHKPLRPWVTEREEGRGAEAGGTKSPAWRPESGQW